MVDGAPGFRYHNTPSRTLAVFLGLSRQADDERHLNGLFHERRMQPGSGRVSLYGLRHSFGPICPRIERGHAFRGLLRCTKAQIKNQY